MKIVEPIKDLRKLDALKQVLSSNQRNYTLLMFGLHSGLRIGDILKLKVLDVRDQAHINIKENKTRKTKRFKVNSTLRQVLNSFILKRDDSEFLFLSREGQNKPLSRFMAYKIIKEASKKVGLEGVALHSLRKTMALHIYENSDHNIGLIMNLLNHSSQKVSLRYLGINSDQEDAAMEMLKF